MQQSPIRQLALGIAVALGLFVSAQAQQAQPAPNPAPDAAQQRRTLTSQYVEAFRHVEAGAREEAKRMLADLSANAAAWVAPDELGALRGLVDGQRAKLG